MNKFKYIKRCLDALIGILLIGTGVAFNAMASLGNDPVGIFYDGIRSLLGLSQTQLGMASNIVNAALIVVLFFIGRKYVNIGTFIYILPYGLCVNIGTSIYTQLFTIDSLEMKILASAIGCLLLYTGVAIYIVMDIGMDPMTGVAMVIRDKLHWDFKKAKWLFDGTMTLLGILFGGKLGVITVVTMLAGGPLIQGISKVLTFVRKGGQKQEENAQNKQVA